MPFIPIMNTRGHSPINSGERREVSLYLNRTPGKTATFRISRSLCADLQWAAGDRIAISIGVGEDVGKVQLSRVDMRNAGQKLHPNGRGWMQCTVTVPEFVGGLSRKAIFDSIRTPAKCDFEYGPNALSVTMPKMRLSVPAVKVA